MPDQVVAASATDDTADRDSTVGQLITLAQFMEQAAIACGSSAALQRRMGVSTSAVNYLSASERVLEPHEANSLARAFGLH